MSQIKEFKEVFINQVKNKILSQVYNEKPKYLKYMGYISLISIIGGFLGQCFFSNYNRYLSFYLTIFFTFGIYMVLYLGAKGALNWKTNQKKFINKVQNITDKICIEKDDNIFFNKLDLTNLVNKETYTNFISILTENEKDQLKEMLKEYQNHELYTYEVFIKIMNNLLEYKNNDILDILNKESLKELEVNSSNFNIRNIL